MEIAGSNIVIDHADIKKCKNIQELKALDIFSHLSDDEADKANAQLWQSVQPKVNISSEKIDTNKNNVAIDFEERK